MVADLCHVVSSPFRGEKAKRRHAKTHQRVTFSCFRMATFRPATRKYATLHALRCCLLFVVSLPGGAKGHHAKTRHNHHLAGFHVATFRVFSPVSRIFAWRGERSPRENPPNCDVCGFSLGDLSPRQAKIRQTGAKTRNICRGQTIKMVKIMFVQEPPRIVIVWAMYSVPLATYF